MQKAPVISKQTILVKIALVEKRIIRLIIILAPKKRLSHFPFISSLPQPVEHRPLEKMTYEIMESLKKKIEELEKQLSSQENFIDHWRIDGVKLDEANQYLSTLLLQLVEPVKLKSLLEETFKRQKREEEEFAVKADHYYKKMVVCSANSKRIKENMATTQKLINLLLEKESRRKKTCPIQG